MSQVKEPDPQASETTPDGQSTDELSAEELDKAAGGVISPVLVQVANPAVVGAQVPNIGGLPQIPGKGPLVL